MKLAQQLRYASYCFYDNLKDDIDYEWLRYRRGRGGWDRDELEDVVKKYEKKADRVLDKTEDLIDELRDHDDTEKEADRLRDAIDDFEDLAEDSYYSKLRLSSPTEYCLEKLDDVAKKLD